jgi:group II intron reverse transcriptase/maturase
MEYPKGREAATVLNVLQQRGIEMLPLENGLYRLLFNPNLYLRAYERIYNNEGALTPGIDADDTADGMKLDDIRKTIGVIRSESYRWKPARQVTIPKKDGKRRALGLPVWSDKILQEVLRSILEAYFEPQFSNTSHGFRPIRGCDTALQTVQRYWKGSKWFIEGDVEQCFDSIDHKILMDILGRKIKDQRFLTLIRRFLDAGYMEDWKLVKNVSGVPQGGILSPLLSNIYLNELDKFVETKLIPSHTSGTKRKKNLEYIRIQQKRFKRRRKGDYSEDKELTAAMRKLPSVDPNDPDYRRLLYIRYADDFLLGFIGPRSEAVQIKEELKEFLSDHLKLKLSEPKTLITHARSQPARFLGYEIQAQYSNDKLDHRGQRAINGAIGLRVPKKTINEYCKDYMKRGKPIHLNMWSLESDFSIISRYGSRLRGITQYFKLAWNFHHLWKLVSIMQRSLLKTLALKFKTTSHKMWKQYKAYTDNGLGQQVRCIEKVISRKSEDKKPLRAVFGGIPLRRDKLAAIRDVNLKRYTDLRSELLQRLLADTCEVCKKMGGIEVHHIRALKDLFVKGKPNKAPWIVKQAAMERLTLIVCRPCHLLTHGGTFKPRQN